MALTSSKPDCAASPPLLLRAFATARERPSLERVQNHHLDTRKKYKVSKRQVQQVTFRTKIGTIVADDQKRIPAEFYRTDAGNEPVRDWLKNLALSDKKIVGTDIKTVEFGWPVGMPTCRAMKKGLFEVRSDLPDKKIARVLFCIYEEKMILLHGLIKKSQKTPKKDLALALERKSRLEARQ